ncbi:MAG: hypothetical protein ACPGJS_17640 [Flammeovirgaceae bacterium]
MLEVLSKYLLVTAWSMFKFIFGPISGVSFGLHPVETYLCTVTGMMLTATLLSSEFTRAPILRLLAFMTRRKKKKRVFSKRARTVVKIWNKFGMKGVAFLTPLLLTPPFGTLVAVSFGARRRKILLYMLISASFWAAILTGMVNYLGVKVVEQYLGTPPM